MDMHSSLEEQLVDGYHEERASYGIYINLSPISQYTACYVLCMYYNNVRGTHAYDISGETTTTDQLHPTERRNNDSN